MQSLLRRLWLVALAVTAVGVLVMATGPFSTATATPGNQFNSQTLAQSLFDSFRVKTITDQFKVEIATKGQSDVFVVRNTVPVGGYSGWHTHPGPSVVLVSKGTATVYDGDDPYCTPAVYHAGSGFIDSGDGHVHMVRNEGTEPLETVAFQIIPHGAARRIDAPAPGTCGF